MMSARLEVPRLDDLSDLDIVIEQPGQPGVVSLTSWANDGSSVILTWDEIAGSVSVRWSDGDSERLLLERESVSKISVRDEHGSIKFRVWSYWEGLGGELIVGIGEHILVRDKLLRR
jgi:hypothetical protein